MAGFFVYRKIYGREALSGRFLGSEKIRAGRVMAIIALMIPIEDPAAEVFFFRTQTGVEIDLLLRLQGELIPIEIKLSLAAQSIQRLERGMGYLGLKRGFIVHMAEGLTEIRRGIWAGSLARIMSCLFRTAKPSSPGK